MVLQPAAAEFAEGDFGALGLAVHQHLGTEGDEEIPLAALAQFEDSLLFGGESVERFPGQGHDIFLVAMELGAHLVIPLSRSIVKSQKRWTLAMGPGPSACAVRQGEPS